MKAGNIFNENRVNSLRVDSNAYNNGFNGKLGKGDVQKQGMEKVVFPQPYENVGQYYDRQSFIGKPQQEAPQDCPKDNPCHHGGGSSMFNLQSILPMLMSGKFNDILKPVMSMFGGGGGGGFDVAKIFELFKPKAKKSSTNKEEKVDGETVVDDVSKFDDFIIIED